MSTLINGLDPQLIIIDTLLDGISLNRQKIFQVELDKAANSGDTTLATITGSVIIESLILKCKTTHADLTSIGVYGGSSKVLEFIGDIDGAAANLNAADKQILWTGNIELGNTKTIVATFTGTGANHVTLTATIRYRPCTLTGTLS